MRVCPKCRSSYAAKTQFCGLDGEQLVETDTDPLLGGAVGRYEIIEAIGRGATGTVYRARHRELGSEFAIKVLFGDLGSDEVIVGRFKREAQVASSIRSSNVVSVIDFNTDEGLAYLVMEYVQGHSLDKLIRDKAPFQPVRVAHLGRGIAAGLWAAHEKGFVHRDVKPSNILVVKEGRREVAKLLDFGIARLEQDQAVTQLTKDGGVVGTPSYMAPEQWRGSKVGPAADLYGLGVVLYEMLAGKKPFRAAELPQLISKHLHEAPPALPPSAGLETLVFSLLAKSESDRPETAAVVVSKLDEILAELDWRVPSYAGAPARPDSRSATDPDLPSADPTPSRPGEAARISAGGSGSSLPAAHMATLGGYKDGSELTGPPPGNSVAWAVMGGAAILGAVGFSAWLFTRSPSATPSSAPPVPIIAAASIDSQRKDLERAFAGSGLTREEATGFPGVSAALSTWEAAVGSGDAAASEAALKPLLSAIGSAKLDKAFISAKLERLQAEHGLLGRVVDKYPEKKDALEQRYGSYYTRLNAEEGASQLKRLAQDIQAFLVELERLDRLNAAQK